MGMGEFRGAIDDMDPDGRGIPGDMRYDHELTRQRLDQEDRIRARRLRRDVVSACSRVVDLDAEGSDDLDAAILALADLLKARFTRIYYPPAPGMENGANR